MRIDFFVKGRLPEWKSTLQAVEEGLLLTGFDAVGEVSYERELKGDFHLHKYILNYILDNLVT